MNRGRNLLVANLLGLLVLVVVLLLGWWDAAAFGLAVLLILDVLVWLRERQARVQTSAEGLDNQPLEPPAGQTEEEVGE
jgi:Flp pilus assembly protein TadB